MYALAGYAVLEYVPQYLGTWAASGVMAILIVLIWQVVVRKEKKEERQIEEQFAIYQGTSEEVPRHSKTDIREWEEKDKEPEAEEITWEKRIPWGGDTYTQILSNGGEQGGLILEGTAPGKWQAVSDRKSNPSHHHRTTERTGRSCPAIHSSKPGPCQYRTTGR